MLFKTSSVFFLTLLTSEIVSLSSGLSYEGTGKGRKAQGRVNREGEQLISLTENKISRKLFVLYYQPS
jgi:hypothetical protein